MEDLNYLEHVRARAEKKAQEAEEDARYQRAIVAAMDEKIAALKATTEGRPHPLAKFRIGEKVRFTEDARGRTGWHNRPRGFRVPSGVLTIKDYRAKFGDNSNWDTVVLSDATYYSQHWLESAEDVTPDPEPEPAPKPPKRPVATTADDLRGWPLGTVIVDAGETVRMLEAEHTWVSVHKGYLRTFEVPLPARIVYNPEKS